MKFFTMLPGQKLILVRVETPQPPPLPVMAKSAGPTQPFWLTFTLWLCAWLRPIIHTVRNSWPNFAVLAFLASIFISVILENIAAGYIEKMVGV